MSEPATTPPLAADNTAPPAPGSAGTPPPAGEQSKEIEPIIKADPPEEKPLLADAKPDAPKVEDKPVEYKFKDVPEGYDTKEIEAFAKEHKLSPDAAQKLVDRDFKIAETILANQKSQFEADQKKWRQDIANDPVLGRENLDKTRANVNNVWQAVPKEIRKEITDSGYSENKTLISLLNFFGSRMGEDSFVGTKAPPQSKAKPGDLETFFRDTIYNK
jgi:hypothetical protein